MRKVLFYSAGVKKEGRKGEKRGFHQKGKKGEKKKKKGERGLFFTHRV